MLVPVLLIPVSSAHAATPTTAAAAATRQPMKKAAPLAAVPLPAQECTTSSDGKTRTCTQASTPSAASMAAGRKNLTSGGVSASSVVPVPTWCGDHQDGAFWAVRNDGCRWSDLTLTTFRILANGTTEITGEAFMSVLQYLYGDPTQATLGYQILVSPWGGWGDAINAKVTGTGSAVSGCQSSGSSFPSQNIDPYISGFRSGESYQTTTATAAGAIATCTDTWTLTFNNGTYPPVSTDSWRYRLSEMRCDNATLGVATPGCVIPWAAETLVYRAVDTPQLVSHVARAQASGLPTLLHRTTNATRITNNRNRACYKAPSIAKKSCDEYPVATSQEGLASLPATTWQNYRRTFSGCSFTLPSQTGAIGASACMISATEQSSQGGTNNAFYREWRYLEGDPFYVSLQ
jgi:hypothetical protein